MEPVIHFLHVFVPGTEENLALTYMIPALAPFQTWAVVWCNNLKTRIGSGR